MASVTLAKYRRDDHIVFRFSAEEAAQLHALAESARKYPGRVRRYELVNASIVPGDRPVRLLELVADVEAREDAVESVSQEAVRFTLCVRGSSAFEEFLQEIVEGAWDLLWSFKKASSDLKEEVMLWVM
jgi:hypothetical protein